MQGVIFCLLQVFLAGSRRKEFILLLGSVIFDASKVREGARHEHALAGTRAGVELELEHEHGRFCSTCTMDEATK